MSLIPRENNTRTQDVASHTEPGALYADDQAWKAECDAVEEALGRIDRLKGTISTSADALLGVLDWLSETGQRFERVMQYAFLMHAADGADSANQRRQSLANQLATRYAAATSFIEPEILAIDRQTVDSWLTRTEFADHRVMLEKMLRFKPHVLSAGEEKIMALQGEVAAKAHEAFGALTNVDFDFGHVETKDGKVPLTQSTYAYLLQQDDRKLRERTYRKFYGVFDRHKNVLTHLYDASVKQDIFRARVRSYPDSRSMFLFPDKVDGTVYDNLIALSIVAAPSCTVTTIFRKRLLGLSGAHYDVYVRWCRGSRYAIPTRRLSRSSGRRSLPWEMTMWRR